MLQAQQMSIIVWNLVLIPYSIACMYGLLSDVLVAGCIYANESSSLAILDSNFTNNFGLSAGAVALWNSTVTVNNTLFQNNTCNSAGESICNWEFLLAQFMEVFIKFHHECQDRSYYLLQAIIVSEVEM